MLKKYLSNLTVPFKYLIRWVAIIVPVGFAIGSAVAFFLWLLNAAIHFRFLHPWLLYLLPLAGLVIHFMYKWYGQSAERGNNLIIDEIHQPGLGVPKRMAPLILVTTVITHLFGGSAGREGTAVQIGGSLANLFGIWFKLDESDTKKVLTAGVAAGFGAVFGTPLTGAVFALEVIVIGKLPYRSILPAMLAGFIGDVTVSLWHIKHTQYHIDLADATQAVYGFQLPVSLLLLVKVLFASAMFGLASMAFEKAIHFVKNLSLKWIKVTWLIPVCGGIIIILLTYVSGKPDYLSLGVEPEYTGAVTIVSAFKHGGADVLSWLWKIIFTGITLGTGFKGGEVTPLFYVGATLGNTLAELLSAPVSLFAGLGFIAVFAGATKTPVACTIMGIELFGSEYALFFAIACFIAYLCSGEGGIYIAQHAATQKMHQRNIRRHYIQRMFMKYKA